MQKNIILKRYHKSMDYSYTFGAAPTIELLQIVPHHIIKVILSTRVDEKTNINLIYTICAKHKIPIEINEKAINRLSDKENCFAIGVFNKFKNSVEDNEPHIVLVNPSNMGNLGTIIRTCVGFGMDNLVMITPCSDIFDPKVVRASMGAVFKIKFSYYESFHKYLNRHRNRKIYTFMLNGSKDINKLERNKDENFSLVFGNEATGLDQSFSKIGQSVLIKHSKTIDSLNLSVAVGIALYEFSN